MARFINTAVLHLIQRMSVIVSLSRKDSNLENGSKFSIQPNPVQSADGYSDQPIKHNPPSPSCGADTSHYPASTDAFR